MRLRAVILAVQKERSIQDQRTPTSIMSATVVLRRELLQKTESASLLFRQEEGHQRDVKKITVPHTAEERSQQQTPSSRQEIKSAVAAHSLQSLLVA